MSKTTRIDLRIEPADKTAWETAARANGLTLSEWIVATCNGGMETVPGVPVTRKAVSRPATAAPADPSPDPARKSPGGLILNCQRCRTIGQPSCPECRKANGMT